MIRLPDWEERLARTIAATRFRPYHIGEHDCASFACAAVLALTGTDLWPEIQGRYCDARGSHHLLDRYGGDFAAAIWLLLGLSPSPPAMGRRGDLACFTRGARSHLAVVIGAQIATPARSGLAFLDRARAAHCWRIG